jgi:multiple sugar transport system permease protein
MSTTMLRPPRRPLSLSSRRRWSGVLLTTPAIAALAVTVVFPLVWTLALSVQDFNPAPAAPPGDFVGLDNYTRILASAGFQQALWQTVGYVLATLALELVVAMPIALALQRETRGRKVLRLVVAFPLMIAPVVGALAWRFLFSHDYGLINAGISLLGVEPPQWFAEIWLARAAILVANAWLALPFVVLVLLAGLTNVPTDILEAARTDGANRAQIFFRIILPLLKPAILIVLVIRLADAFRTFDAVYVLTGGGPANSTELLSTYLYKLMFTRTDFSGAAAATVLFVIIVGVMAGALFAILRERQDRS